MSLCYILKRTEIRFHHLYKKNKWEREIEDVILMHWLVASRHESGGTEDQGRWDVVALGT
jgi:homoserine acetyltransferase